MWRDSYLFRGDTEQSGSDHCFTMGDFQQYDQNFYQTDYYVDDQGQVAYSYDPSYPLGAEYQEG